MECTISRTSNWFGIAPEPSCIGAKKNEEGKWYIEINTLDVLRSEFKSLATRLPSLRTNSYFVSTVGGAPLAVVKQYIESQKTSKRE